MTHVVRRYQHSLAPHRGIDAPGMILDSSKFREISPFVGFAFPIPVHGTIVYLTT